MRRIHFLLCALVLVLTCVAGLQAQVSTASLTGLVTDPSNAVLPSAKVTVKNKATNIETNTQTDASGYYVFPSLPVGSYAVTVEMQGFKRGTQEVTLETGQRARQDFTMQLGSVETTVEVQAQAPQLATQDASLGTVVDTNYVSNYPLLLRSWDDLLTGVAGVQGLRYTDQGGGTSFGRTGGFNVHGIRSMHNNFLLDGVDNNSISENVQELSTQVVRPSVDSIQEFKITTNPYAAEYGRSPGAAISVTTKGGTNKFHGTAYEYLRNRVFDANDFFSNKNKLVKPQNVQNQFGANLGGPILKDKLFFFFDWESTRIRRGLSRITTVPLPNERVGDFTTTGSGAARINYATIYDPLTNQPFPNNQIPSARIDPVAAKVMALFPAPTNLNVQANDFARNAGQLDDADRYNWRVDWQPTSKDAVFGRYSYSTRDRFIPGNFGGIADGTSSSALGGAALKGHNFVLGWTRPFTTRLVNEFRFGIGRNDSFAFQDPFGKNKVSDYIPGVPDNPVVAGGISRITFTGFDTFIGSPDFLPKFQKTLQYQWSDTVSWTRGKHQIKFGGDLRAPLRNIFLDVPAMRGFMNFNRIFTCQRAGGILTGGCVSSASGISYADFLLGYVERASLTSLYVADQRLHMYSFFVGDDYKVTPKLTLNLGLRYDFATPAMEGRNRITNFDPSGTGSYIFAKSGDIQSRTLVNADRNNWAPRLGIAYQVNQKTVVRTGYGIFYALFDRIGSEDQLTLNLPQLIQNDFQVASTSSTPVFILKSGFPSNYLDPNNPRLQQQVRTRGANPNAPNTYVQQWSFSIQRTLPWNWFLETSYVGTRTTRLNTLRNFNQPVWVNGVRTIPYPNFGQIEYRDPLGNAVYHGLELTLERRFRNGLGVRSVYTWSRSIDNTSEHLASYGSSSFNQNGRDFRSWRGPSEFDVTHRWFTSYIYELPFGKGKTWAKSGWFSYVVGGFQMSGSAGFATGRPYTVTAGNNSSVIDTGLQGALPNIIGPVTEPRNVDCWFYHSGSSLCRAIASSASNAFANAPTSPAANDPTFAARFGNEGRNILRGPGTAIWDFSVQRNFSFGEQRALVFRWEAFNLFNHPLFGLPNRNINSGSVGSITTLASDARIMQFSLRFKF